MLDEGNTNLKNMESFQGEAPEVFKEKSPLAGILSTVYTVRIVELVASYKLSYLDTFNQKYSI